MIDCGRYAATERFFPVPAASGVAESTRRSFCASSAVAGPSPLARRGLAARAWRGLPFAPRFALRPTRAPTPRSRSSPGPQGGSDATPRRHAASQGWTTIDGYARNAPDDPCIYARSSRTAGRLPATGPSQPQSAAVSPLSTPPPQSPAHPYPTPTPALPTLHPPSTLSPGPSP